MHCSRHLAAALFSVVSFDTALHEHVLTFEHPCPGALQIFEKASQSDDLYTPLNIRTCTQCTLAKI